MKGTKYQNCNQGYNIIIMYYRTFYLVGQVLVPL
jgi:hypothetical protein